VQGARPRLQQGRHSACDKQGGRGLVAGVQGRGAGAGARGPHSVAGVPGEAVQSDEGFHWRQLHGQEEAAAGVLREGE